MKKLVLTLLVLPLLATARITTGSEYRTFKLTPHSGSQFSFVLNKKVKTDGCNSYGLKAMLRPVDRAHRRTLRTESNDECESISTEKCWNKI